MKDEPICPRCRCYAGANPNCDVCVQLAKLAGPEEKAKAIMVMLSNEGSVVTPAEMIALHTLSGGSLADLLCKKCGKCIGSNYKACSKCAEAFGEAMTAGFLPSDVIQGDEHFKKETAGAEPKICPHCGTFSYAHEECKNCGTCPECSGKLGANVDNCPWCSIMAGVEGAPAPKLTARYYWRTGEGAKWQECTPDRYKEVVRGIEIVARMITAKSNKVPPGYCEGMAAYKVEVKS